MNNMEIKTKNLKLAQVRYFDSSHNGVEIPELKAFVFLVRVGDTYINILNPTQELPVYDRVPYTNTTRSGEDFGTKIILASGECKSGPCYVIENLGMDNIFGEEVITMKQLEQFVLASNLFFIDRVDLMKDRKVVPFNSKFREDLKKSEAFKQYLESCRKEEMFGK